MINRGDSVDHRIRRELRVKGRKGNRVILKPVSGPMKTISLKSTKDSTARKD